MVMLFLFPWEVNVKNWRNYEIEFLTPVHIGSGEKIYPLEYVIKHKEFVRIDIDKLFTDPSFNRERFIKDSRKRDFYLGEFDKNTALRHPLYRINITQNTARELKNNIRTPVLDFIKEGKEFYIPGSSIKGAIRTAILWNLLQKPDIKEKYQNSLKKELAKKRDQKKGKKTIRERFSLASEESILGKPYNSLLRAIQIGDSDFIPPSYIYIEISKVLSKKGNAFSWKQLGQVKVNTDNPEDAMPIFFEAIMPGTIIKGKIKIDEFLVQPEVAKSLNYSDTTLLKEIAKTCNNIAQNHLEKEWNFFRNIRLSEIQNEIEKIKNIPLTDNEFLVHLAWGGGYESKAMGNTLDKSLFNEIKNEFRLGKTGLEFPKTRKIIFDGNRPKTIIGWIKIKLEE